MTKTMLFLAVTVLSSFSFADIVTCHITNKLTDTVQMSQTVVVKLAPSTRGQNDSFGTAFTQGKFEKVTAYTRFETFSSMSEGRPVQRGWELLGVKIETVDDNEGDLTLKFAVSGESQIESKVQLQLNETYSAVCSFSEEK